MVSALWLKYDVLLICRYGLVRDLDTAEAFKQQTLQCFKEMAAAGITTCGEFHYFRHVNNPTCPEEEVHISHWKYIYIQFKWGVSFCYFYSQSFTSNLCVKLRHCVCDA